MNVTGVEFFDQLNELHLQPYPIKDKYPRLRSFLERVCKDMTANDNIQFSNLFSRLNYVCRKTKLPSRRIYQVNTFRVNANSVLFAGFIPTEEDYLHDLKALCHAVSHFYELPIPADIEAILPEIDLYRPIQKIKGDKYPRLRVEVVSFDDNYIYAFAEDMPTEDPVSITYPEEFNATISELWRDCQLNLIDVVIDEDGVLFPEIIILEPDYLIDISSLAECMKEYGNHPLNYIHSRFEAAKNTTHLLLGNAANIFLDEFVNEKSQEPVLYKSAMRKAFKAAPLEFATCSDLNSKEHEYTFFESTITQFKNIERVVKNFRDKGIDREYGILEPAFLCEHLGVQGRLDYLQLGAKKPVVIELKSGKAPSPDTNYELIGKNHNAQAFIYQIIIQKILGVPFKNLETFIFYSKYNDEQANLRLSAPFMTAIKEILNIRNLIVAGERNIAADTTGQATREQIAAISPDKLITNSQLNDNFLNRFIVPQINHFVTPFSNASRLEAAYFHNFYAFVTREHYISKTGGADYEGSKGISSLWLSTLEEKLESGEILMDLTISENNAEKIPSTVTLKIPAYEDDFLPNFRQGDIVILYQRNHPDDNVTNKQVFKGVIASLDHDEVTVQLRQQQRNQSVLPAISLYAIEHDFLDSTYTTMYRGLYSFLQANPDRKSLLLNQRTPLLFAGEVPQVGTNHSLEVRTIVQKAKHAKDYFLLVGPPGTGKTSIALKEMVKEFYHMPGGAILLLSYTNRAVDEICDALNTIEDTPEYIRIGSSLSCAAAHRCRLMDQVIADCDSREQVKLRIQQFRIIVGTVAAISGKMDLFRIRHFQVAIIDEASQILEPHLLGILSAKHGNGNNAIDKFILIGDHKQLPAVVLQNSVASQVKDPALQAIGLHDSRNSLFERLYNLHKHDKSSPFWGMLHKQGRMHPDIALFPNYAFYNNELSIVPCTHQQAEIEFKKFSAGNVLHEMIATKRLAFIPSERNKNEKTNKTNSFEATFSASLVKNIYELYLLNGLDFIPEESVGIITPYRSQIALIRREIAKLGIPVLNQLTIDTVERFQGSQRDIIIYSFSVNQFYQIDFLSNNMEEDGKLIDRKLNVAITRAKKQLFITGNPAILSNNITYYRLIEFIRSRETLQISSINIDDNFNEVFKQLVITPVRNHPATRPPSFIYGNDHDYNKLCLTEYGRANFDLYSGPFSPSEKVDLYCYYYMRQQYSSLRFGNVPFSERTTFIDLVCGPLTGGLAFRKHQSSFQYVGIDHSPAMLAKAAAFAASGLLHKDNRVLLKKAITEIDIDYWDNTFLLPNTVVIHLSARFATLSKEEVEQLSIGINQLVNRFPLNKYVLCAADTNSRMYHIFRRLVSIPVM